MHGLGRPSHGGWPPPAKHVLSTLPSPLLRQERWRLLALPSPLKPLSSSHRLSRTFSKMPWQHFFPIRKKEEGGSSPTRRIWPWNTSPGPSGVGLSLVAAQITWTPLCISTRALDWMGHSKQGGRSGSGGRRGSQHLLVGTRFIQTDHTPQPQPWLGQRRPPTHFSGRREARARDWRIKFDLKEFYRSAQ